MPNALINETSPYLLQHAHNPVDWYPWGEAALAKAKTENKLLLISIGYSACHWCHVMERESFENETIAALMNDLFVCVKVDREERPDVDQVYMDAVQMLTGQGGWPLNCFALPDGRPLWGGTYFPPENWGSILKHLALTWQNQTTKAYEQGEQLAQTIRMSVDFGGPKTLPTNQFDELTTLYLNMAQRFDNEWGGMGEQPKFPVPVNFRFLLRFATLTKNAQTENFIRLSLDKMAYGGIYDQIGGGFARYSVDRLWHVPHFEKMLYDNAQMVGLYAEAFQLTKDPLYQRAVEETLAFVERELTSPEGAFYAAIDADSEGVEGKFYVWTFDQIQAALGEEAALCCDYFSITPEGNWEHSLNVLICLNSDRAFAERYNLTLEELYAKRKHWQAVLLAERAKRIRPNLDDKILLSWNALMIKGYIEAYRVFNRAEYLTAAKRALDFISENMTDGLQLYRNYKAGRKTILAYLEDYACLIEALIAYYQATFKESALIRARELTDFARTQFQDADSGLFYFTSANDTPLFARKKDIYDTVIPSSNSLMANNLYLLGVYFENESYQKDAERMFAAVKKTALQHGGSFANWAILLLRLVSAPYEIAITGEQALERRVELDQQFFPNLILSGSLGDSTLPLLQNKFVAGETNLFLCREKVCQSPAKTVDEVLKMLV